MSLPANIRVNVGAPFPATVKGLGAIAVSKANGIWTIFLNYLGFGTAGTVPDPANTYTLVWNILTGVFTLIPISAVSGTKVVKTITAAGPYAALPSDEVLIIKQTVGAAFTVNVDWSARSKPLRVVDGKADASINNIKVTPAAGQTQLGMVNFSYVIDSIGGSVILTPLPDGSGAY
jgi:hypothetical protein